MINLRKGVRDRTQKAKIGAFIFFVQKCSKYFFRTKNVRKNLPHGWNSSDVHLFKKFQKTSKYINISSCVPLLGPIFNSIGRSYRFGFGQARFSENVPVEMCGEESMC